MAKKTRPPRRRRLGIFEAQDKVMSLNTIYRTEMITGDRIRSTLMRRALKDLDEVSIPEPDEELLDSELSDAERRAAIARERMRREGRA